MTICFTISYIFLLINIIKHIYIYTHIIYLILKRILIK